MFYTMELNEVEGSVQTLSENKASVQLCSAAANLQDETKDGKKLSPVRLVSCIGLWENRSGTKGIVVRKLVPGVKSKILD